MHRLGRERVLKSHLSLSDRCGFDLKNHDDCKKLVETLLLEEHYTPSYISVFLSTLDYRGKMDKQAFHVAKKHLVEKNRLLESAYKIFNAPSRRSSSLRQTKGDGDVMFDKHGKLCHFSEVLGERYKDLFNAMKRRKLRHITQDEAKKILVYLSSNPALHELELLLRIIWANGSRKNEVYQLTNREVLQQLIDTKHTLVQGKTLANQDFILDDRTHAFLKLYVSRYCQTGDTGDGPLVPLFKVSERTHLNMYKRVLIDLRIDARCSIHHWRSLFSVRATQKDISMCQNIMNHSNLSMTKRYVQNGIANDYSVKEKFLNSLNNNTDDLSPPQD